MQRSGHHQYPARAGRVPADRDPPKIDVAAQVSLRIHVPQPI